MSGIQAIMSRMAEINALVVPASRQAEGTSGSEFAASLTDALGQADTAGSATGADAVTAAQKYLGVPYVWGGTDPDSGLDCSGLVQRVYADLGVDLPRVSRDQAKVGTAVASLDQAKPGDLVAFGSPVHHIGIYIGDGKMIHAPEAGQDVKVGKVYETPTAIRRVLPETSTATTSSLTGLSSLSGLSGLSGLTSSDSLTALTGKYGVSSGGSSAYASLFTQATQKYGLPTGLLSAVAKAESNYNPNAVSGAGAQGLMQLMPSTAKGLGVDAMNPSQAVDGAARLLKSHLETFGTVPLALAAYNAGPGAVRKYDGVPPYTETQNYVRKIMANLNSGVAA
ncbi:transglycosylase SLT domain-containing protein [Actinokineospora terrae]|uniref:Cell wall-associated hydrolase, NlpC family n=1 Tax=Actinokineospora terrae TaxID=155974 RepID=A0A1H9X033_9PSEU|nr:transglycosylase SLT domain-containing protein [Actinokineospora terrae]SES39449.1 Cell wall-associated hydrolase, NlpC family [Actinokineospora terrae]